MGEPGPPVSRTLRSGGERREAERFAAAMPLIVDGFEWTTHDLSTTGLSFRSVHEYAPGTHVEVVIEYLLDGHQYPLHCRAEVVRSEAEGDGWRVGARLLPQSRIAPVPPREQPVRRSRHLRSVT
jgi:hypothetical protein